MGKHCVCMMTECNVHNSFQCRSLLFSRMKYFDVLSFDVLSFDVSNLRNCIINNECIYWRYVCMYPLCRMQFKI